MLTTFSPAGSDPDAGAVRQMNTCLDAGNALAGVLCADHHLGYSMPIGGTIAYYDQISPSGVGYDIGCGNKAVSTSLFYSDVREDMPGIMDEIARRISFGMGRPNDEPVDHPVIDQIMRAEMRPVRALQGLAARQLGTVGSGNHYVDILREETTDRIWVGVHFGSRGFGHKIASGFLALAEGKAFDERAVEEEMHSPPVLLDINSSLGYLYAQSMQLAGDYAYAGRDTVVNKVLEILGNPAVLHEVHNHHNFAWFENHGGNDVWVVRKGATPLFPGQQGFVGGSMGDYAVIIEGASNADIAGTNALWSAPHGAGRVMSRTEAKGKQRKRSQCQDCGHQQQRGEAGFTDCPECSSPNVRKNWVQESEGKIDWKLAQAKLRKQDIELRGGDADEAPLAYKRLPEVLTAHKDYVNVLHRLVPIGVAMAGRGTVDYYKD